MARKTLVFLLAGAMVFCFASPAFSDVPHMINYQGKLTDAGGGLVTDTLQVTFSIYPDTLGSPADWSETQSGVEVLDGIFNVLLGSVDTIPQAVFDGTIKYLGIQVELDPEMTPLRPIVSAPYAYRAAAGDGGGGSNGWVDDGVVVYAQWECSGYGNLVIVDHNNGYVSYYAHLYGFYVDVGQALKRGQPLGVRGNTGYSTGPHLHFEIRHNGVQLDPLSVLPAR